MKQKIKIEIAVGLIAAVALAIGLFVWQESREIKYANPSVVVTKKSNPTFCTQEAKLCADGSYVSRTEPNCEFAVCPTGTSKRMQLNQLYSKDSKNAYYGESSDNNPKNVDGVDINTFQAAGDIFAKDKNKVYIPDNIDHLNINFDAQTFEVLSAVYMKDKNKVTTLYRSGGANQISPLTQVDNNTFQALGGAFGKDKNHIYYYNQIINSADLATFKLTGSTMETNGNGQDKNNLYKCSQNEVCGSGCIITNLKTGKKITNYFGPKSQTQDPICNQ
jgi:hypothetical protein